MAQSSEPIAMGARKVTSLVVDFLAECAEYHKIRFHAPVLFGLRESIGMRGLYLAEGHRVKRNRPIFTVPFSGMISAENIVKQPFVTPVSLRDIESVVVDEEMKPLASHFLFGYHFANLVSRVNQQHTQHSSPSHSHPSSPTTSTSAAVDAEQPPSSSASSFTQQQSQADATFEAKQAEYEARVRLFTSGIMPWARMLDDENWSEEHVLGMHQQALDKWQMQDYVDLTNMFNRNMTEIHATLKPACRLDDLKRITRVVIARTEQVPQESELLASKPVRLFRKAYRAVTKTPKPRPDLRLVPLMDMLNYSNRANTWMRVLPDGSHLGVPGPCATLYSLSDIEGGRELCRYYNFGMSRGNALFRYGFLPFEMLALDNFDPWKEHYAKGVMNNLAPESEVEQRKRHEVESEVARLQQVYSAAKDGQFDDKKTMNKRTKK